MNRKLVISKKNYAVFFLLAVVFMYFFSPYKLNTSIAVNFLIGLSIMFFSLYHGKMTKKRALLVLFVIFYLMAVTLFAGLAIPYSKELDLGVFLIIVSICVYCGCDFQFPASNMAEKIIAALDVIVIIWGLCFLIGFSPMTDLTSRLYGADGDAFFSRSILLRKPVISLRFHGQAGYAYINLFLLNYFLSEGEKIRKAEKKIMRISQFIFMVYAVCLQSNSGYVIALVMGVFLTYRYFKIYGAKVFIVWGIAIIAVLYVLMSKGIISHAIDHAMTGEKNGFLGRYSGLFAGNLEIISKYYASGIYTIENYTVKSDSGILVALTRGNIIFVISYYALIGTFLKRNFEKKEALLIALVFLCYEFAYTFLIGRYQGLYWLIMYKICLDSSRERSVKKSE